MAFLHKSREMYSPYNVARKKALQGTEITSTIRLRKETKHPNNHLLKTKHG